MSVNWSEIVSDLLKARPQLELPRRLKLPVLPQSVVEFTSIAEKPETRPKELAAPIEADSALTSELLRQVNSIGVGLRQRVASVTQAINLFGPRRTKTLVLCCALQAATSKIKPRLINTTQFQKENRVRAFFARETAHEIGCDMELSYTAGLLQDFLLPLLSEAFYSDYSQLFQQDRELVEQERERFGWDHAQIAAGLMHDWGFPDELIAAVYWHHDVAHLKSNTDLHTTPVSAVIAAASLPECLCQSPQGFETLLSLQEWLPNFAFLEVASVVDEVLCAGDAVADRDEGLCEQLGKLVAANLEQRRLDRVHQFRQLGNYTLEEQIGEGGMGVVYRARHCMLKRPAAIKVLRSTKLGPNSLSRFETEVQLTCQLTSPHTVAVYDYGVTSEGLFYYAMEYLDGITLAQLVHDYGPQSSGRIIHLLKQACCSLAEAHAAGLIHRDLKPENLMICCRGGIPDTLKVLDFGLAKAASDQTACDHVPIGLSGTPLYMSPETIRAEQAIDARSDLYSLGAVAYFLLTGSPVFSGATVSEILRQHLRAAPQRPSERLGTPVDSHLESLILQCLAKSPADRPKDAQQLSQMLNEGCAEEAWQPAEASQWWTRHEAFLQANASSRTNICDPTRIIIA